MEALAFVYLPYLCIGILLLGIGMKAFIWLQTPVPLRIVTTPAPKTRLGVIWRSSEISSGFPTSLSRTNSSGAPGFSFTWPSGSFSSDTCDTFYIPCPHGWREFKPWDYMRATSSHCPWLFCLPAAYSWIEFSISPFWGTTLPSCCF